MKKRNDNKRKRGIDNLDFLGYAVTDDVNLAIEKEKAKKLRYTSWWSKKSSSGICYYCGIRYKPNELTMDHIIPLSRGGKSEKYNLVPACKDCNNKKKYQLPTEWEEHLQRIKKV
jgi:5-methylcytosine-specific restriction endonuclease McrA